MTALRNDVTGTRWLLLAVAAVAVAAVVLALVAWALRRQARPRLVRTANEITPADLQAFKDAFDAARKPAPSWWALGALSLARRAAAEPEALEEPAIWHELLADWPRLRAAHGLVSLAPAEPVGPHGGSGWSLAGHAHQDADALQHDRFALAEVSA